MPRKVCSQTAVVVISHNYGRFLGNALDSVLKQTVHPAEILVVDDSSDDNTAEVARSYESWGVKYLRVEARHVWDARLAGLNATQSRYLIFLDADDMLPEQYIAAAERAGRSPEVGIVFTDAQRFGSDTRLISFWEGNIERDNFIHSAAMVRRAALLSIDLPSKGCQTHSDWHLWRALLRAGWQATKSPVPLWYRRHPDAMLQDDGLPYCQRAALDLETVQIVVPCAGRPDWIERIRQWVAVQPWPRVSLLIADSSCDPDFAEYLRDWLARLNCDTQLIRLPGTGPAADLPRKNNEDEMRLVCSIMPRLYNAIRPRLTSEYVFWLEDDILPPLDAISRLMQSMDSDVAAVSGMVPSRFDRGYSMTWRDDWRIMRGRGVGVEQVTGTGFGCLLVRRSEIMRQPFHTGIVGHYDQDFALGVKQAGLRWLIDWSVGCWHQAFPPESVEPRA